MKKVLIAALSTIMFSQKSNADFTDNLKRYALPCVVSIAGASLFVKNDGPAIGIIGCGVTVTYGEFTDSSKNVSPELEKKMIELADQVTSNRVNSLKRDQDLRIDSLVRQVEDAKSKDRDVIRNLMTDMAVILEQDLEKRLNEKMRDASFVPEMRRSMIEKVKEEVAAEFKIKNEEMINQVVDRVVRRVTTEPIAVPEKTKGK